MRLTCLCLLLASALPASAGLYRHTDAEGRVLFSDRPLPGAERIALPPGNRLEPEPDARPAPPAATAPASLAPPAYPQLQILHPAADANLRSNDGSLQVQVASQPPLQAGHRYRLLLDGQSLGEAGRDGRFVLREVDRGSHQLVVEIVDGEGRVLGRSAAHPFHLQRTSRLQPQRRP